MMDEMRDRAINIRPAAQCSPEESKLERTRSEEEIVRRPTAVPDALWALLRQLDSDTAS